MYQSNILFEMTFHYLEDLDVTVVLIKCKNTLFLNLKIK